ncbi:MAG TPA: carboxypeptidase regulatory-like domain-containing protein [Candidatus Acidoferrum sp.]|nr:carboxypeptidase regulatory-like domain-containing protein [Candidatus Acidoferrum sp.]
MLRSVRVAGVIAVCFLGAVCAYGQFSGNIEGVVMDPTGAAVAGASLQLRNLDTGVAQSMTASSSGNYSFNNLPPGNYVLSVSAKGFQTTDLHVTVSTAQLQGINVTLPVGAVSESTTVTSEAPAVDTDDTRVQTTLSSQLTRDLPTVNRNLWDVLAVQPGVVGTGTRGAGESPGGLPDNFGTQTPQISANGRSYTGNVVFVDGLNVTSPVQNGNIILAPIPDAVQEASLQTNSFDAENNLGSSILIQVTTKSGTNQFHGSGDLFFTNQDLQAVPDFQNTVAPFSRKDLVGTLGGPIKKDKAFFFADVEKLWAKNPEQLGTATWDDPAFDSWANTNFASNVGTEAIEKYPATYLHSTGVASTAETYVPAGSACSSSQSNFTYTAQNGASAIVPCNLPVLDTGSFVFSPYYNALQYNFRLDYYLTNNDRLYLSYYNDSFDQQQPDPRANLAAVNIMRNRYGQVDYTHVFNANLLLEGAFGFASVGGANGEPVSGQDLSVPVINVNDGSEGYNIGSGWGPGEYRGPNYNWKLVLNWVHGPHTFKFGYEGDHAIEHGDFTPVNVRPTFTFNNLFDLVLDNPYTENVGAYNPLSGDAGYVIFGGQTNPFGFFAQDDWKAKRNLTLTLALRWDDFTNHTPWANVGCGAPADSCFKFSDIILGSGSTIEQQIAGASVAQRNNGVFNGAQSNYWSPRIGVAWDPTGHAKWVIRGGIGVYRDWVVLGQSVDEMRNNPPSVLSETFIANGFAGATTVQPDFAFAPNGGYPFNFPLPPIPALTLNSRGGYNSSGVPLPTAVWSLAPNLVPPLSVNYVVGIEHQLPWQLVGSVSYSGSRSYDGLTGSDWNRCAGCTAANRPNPYFGTMNYVTNSNASTYNSMILGVRRNAGSRGSFQASYTLSHAMDYPEAGTRFDQDGGLAIPDPSAYFSYWGDANWDVRQRLSFSGLYNIPGMKSGFGEVITNGWEVSSLAAIQSGTPFWVVCGGGSTCDYNNDGVIYDIPDAPSANFTGSHSRDAYKSGLFTASDFPVPAADTEGNLQRNIYRNPGYFQVDASVIKNTHVPWLGEGGNFQLRFEFLNLFNVANLGAVDANLADTTFGKVTTALQARQIELAARISF